MITLEELKKVCFGGEPNWDNPNIDHILEAVNIVRKEYGKPMIPSCFYRSPEWDISKGRSGNSQHCLCNAIDFSDPRGELGRWCVANIEILEKASLYLEQIDYTPGWVHLDMKARKNRIFIP